MFPKPKIKVSLERKAHPIQVTDTFVLHFEDVKPVRKAAKLAHRMVYLVAFSMIASSLAFCVCRAV
jgi:hypothetical protein